MQGGPALCTDIGGGRTPLRRSTQFGRRRSEFTGVYRLWTALRLARAALLTALGTLALLTVAPVALGWQPSVVTSGSMAPAIRTGDVVLTSPVGARDAATLPAGSVVLVRDPSRPGGYLLHRLVARNPDGTLKTKGDANLSADRAPVSADHLRGVGRLRIPYIGVPVLRARQGDLLPAAALVVITVALSAARLRPRAG